MPRSETRGGGGTNPLHTVYQIYKENSYKEQLIDDFKSVKDLDKFLRIIYNGNEEDMLLFHFIKSDIYKIE